MFSHSKSRAVLRGAAIFVIYLLVFIILDSRAHVLEVFPGIVAWYPPDGLSFALLLTLGAALDIPYCHHEKWDGTGYPRQLKGEDIPIAARIFAIVDVYDALTSDRPYRKGWSQEKTLQHIRELSGSHFDPNIVDMFLKMVEEDR